MQPTTDNFPVFEANQVLTNAHLNQSFDYLDEQERLTRANLIGIGIVCGLNLTLDNPALPTALSLSKGCGVTSAGYLIIEPDDVTLTSYRQYTLPADLAYTPLATTTLWELFPAGEPETAPLNSPAGFLNDKAVLLFLELKKESLRNCSANNCDDKGAKITISVRRLLIGKTELDAVIAASSSLEGLPDQALQLSLPDIRLPRFDVAATSPATSNAVLAAFLQVFNSKKLATAMATALTQAYQAFQPLLNDRYPDNPFADFANTFGFLDTTPLNTEQVRFLQYYYDFFDDLIRAYDEFRSEGAALLCACCPPSGLFPRHILLSLLYPTSDSEAKQYRHAFIASPAIAGCEQRAHTLTTLFQRMVEMTRVFTQTPLPPAVLIGGIDAQIRITPNKHGDVALSGKAIPYYYLQNGTPPLYQLWNPALNQAFKAHLNLAYRADEYVPPAPDFVTTPLAYDLEAYNFLRIEGHLGKSYQTVLKSILELKNRYRLPINVLALRSGAFDSNVAVDLTQESCRFQDLEALYATARGATLCSLVKALTYFYNLTFQVSSPVTTPVKSQFAVINTYAPDFLVNPTNTLGRLFEDYITSLGGTVPEINASILVSWINFFTPQDSLVYYSFFYLIKLSEALPVELSAVNFASLDSRFKNLSIVVAAIESRREAGRGNLANNIELLNWEEIDDRLEDLQNSCQADVFKTLQSEYESRITDLKKKQFFSEFVQKHPGIQHKAGVPMGGTFILVYHQDPPAIPFIPLILDLTSRGIDPMASGVLLSVHTAPVNLGDIVFPPFVFRDDIKLAGGNTIRNDGLTVNVRDTGNLVANPAAVNPIIRQTVLEAKTEPAITPKFTTRTDKINLADAGNTRLTESPILRNQAASISNSGLVSGELLNPGRSTVNQSILDAIGGIQAQPDLITPDIQDLLDGLTNLLPNIPIIPIFPGPFDLTSPADSIIATAVNGLADGTVIADFYLPYLCCSDCAPIEFVLPKAPPIFTVNIGCTDNTQEVPVAEVTITAKDGTPPYRLQLNNGEFTDLNNPYLLSVGEHTLTLQDADNVQSAPQTITIPDFLRLDTPAFACAEDGLTYTATLTISGGELPYSVNGALINGVSFTSAAIASGAAFTLSVTDARNCALETTLTHTCPPPCDLPDDGASRRCAYRLWLQQAIDDEIYEDYKQATDVRLTFNSTSIDLGATADLLQISADDLNRNFRQAVAETIKKLNDVVNTALDNTFGRLSRNRIAISYEPARTDPFSIFWIEYFVNDMFSFEFDYAIRHSVASGEFGVQFGNTIFATGASFNGTTFIDHNRDNLLTRIPAFACSERNQCTNSEFVPMCSGFDLIPVFNTERGGENTFNFFITEAMPTNGIAAWVWEFTTSTDRPFYVGDNVRVVWNNIGGLIKLTAISDQGCFSTTLSDRR